MQNEMSTRPANEGPEEGQAEHKPAVPAPETPSAPPAEETLTPEEIAALKETAAQCEELRDRLLRVQANYENALKRLAREMQDRADHALEEFARDLLPVLDNLELAIRAAENHNTVEKILDGIRLVQRQFFEVLGRHGITPVSSEPGEVFDPKQHEALCARAEQGRQPNVILETIQRGFRLHRRLLRPARVVVSAAPPESGHVPPPGPESKGADSTDSESSGSAGKVTS